MPTYQYTCENCHHTLEIFHSISKEPLEACPQCHKKTLKRGIGGGLATLNFKGEGFYITDYPKGKKEKKGAENSHEA